MTKLSELKKRTDIIWQGLSASVSYNKKKNEWLISNVQGDFYTCNGEIQVRLFNKF